jgi:hypothetical protein
MGITRMVRTLATDTPRVIPYLFEVPKESTMSGDYKWDIQVRAEQIAEDEHGCDFYDLSDELQDKVYQQATEGYADSLAFRADYLNDLTRGTNERRGSNASTLAGFTPQASR